jgi:predicted RNase H-like HicB family nuclease
MKTYTFQLAFEPDPQGGYTVTVPALPGCVTYGATMEEARRMAQDAIALYVEDMTASDEKVPEESGTLWSTVEVEVPAR